MSDIMSCGSDRELDAAVAAAADVVGDGECIVLPTDTVYGIGCDAFSAAGVQTLLGAKGRTREMPPPVLIARPEVMEALADEVSEDAHALARAFWPGALTIVCWAQPSLGWDLGETHGTVALRVPDDAVTRAVLDRVGPMAVSSANRTGLPAAQDAQRAHEMLQDRVALYLDDGPRPSGDVPRDARDTASTIVDCTGETPVVLRHGAISLQRLRQVVPTVHGGSDGDTATGSSSDEPRESDATAASPGSEETMAVPGSAEDRGGASGGGSAAAGTAAVREPGPSGSDGLEDSDGDIVTAMVRESGADGGGAVDQGRDRSRDDEPRWGGTSALSIAEARELVAGDRHPDRQD